MVKVKTISFLEFMRIRISHLQSCGRFGTARNYERAVSSFSLYLGGGDISLRSVTDSLIDGYGAFLMDRGVMRNTISFYMRILRAAYNRAVKIGLVKQAFPFDNAYTGVDKTCKRAVDERIVSVLSGLDLAPDSPMALARDLFIFSYSTRGMAFVDVAYLKKDDLKNGNIRYSRRKTGQVLRVRIEPGIRMIIDRYAGASAGSDYVFPILRDTEPKAAYRQYQSALNRYNRMLRRLSGMLPYDCSLTSYTSRHSWATAARRHDVPVSVISAALGHTSERTTQIYLDNIENSVIDAANRKVLTGLGAMAGAGRKTI